MKLLWCIMLFSVLMVMFWVVVRLKFLLVKFCVIVFRWVWVVGL